MSSGMNHVTLFGNLGQSPELRVSGTGVPILKLRIATNDAYYDKERQLVERTDWHDVVLFGNRADALSRILKRGDAVVVEGSIRYSSYEKDGVTRKSAEIMARDLCLASKRKGVTVTMHSPAEVGEVPPEDVYSSTADTQPVVEPAAAAESEAADAALMAQVGPARLMNADATA